MKIIGVIPARWASTRFPGKVLAEINGKPMIQYVWEGSKQSQVLDDVLIASDDTRVKEAAAHFGARVVMTPSDLASGTDRIAAAVKDFEADIVVNIQGDEPLISGEVIDALVRGFRDDMACPVATMARRIDDPVRIADPNVVKVVINQNGYALYFSRHGIPYNRDNLPAERIFAYQHIGLYAYRKDFLMGFHALPESVLEQTEKLEQLRVLEAGYSIKVIETDFESVGVDTPGDLERVIQLLK